MGRLLPVAVAGLLASALGLAGCGGVGGDSGALARYAAPGTVLYVEATVRPSGELRADADRVAGAIAGGAGLGDLVVEELERSAREDGEPLDFEAEVEPWLGERVAFAFERVRSGGELSEPLLVAETSDAEAARRFIDRRAEASESPYRDASHDGVEFRVDADGERAVGVVDGDVVVAAGEEAFRAALDAARGDSLADEDRFDETMEMTTRGSLADAYVDLGAILEQSGDEVDPRAASLLRGAGAGVDPRQSAVAASLMPGEGRVVVDLRADLGDSEPPSGEPSALIDDVPARAFAALGLAGFGEQLRRALERADEGGLDGELPPGRLKAQLGAIGLDLDELLASIGDAAVFAEGRDKRGLGGALLLDTDDPAGAREAIAAIGRLVGGGRLTGVTRLSGRVSGFAIRDPDELGDKPVVVVSRGERIAIGYGLPQTLRAVGARGAALSRTPGFEDAAAALGETPIAAFVDGPRALRLADALVPASSPEYRQARRYLRSVESIAAGSGVEGDVLAAKLIVSLR